MKKTFEWKMVLNLNVVLMVLCAVVMVLNLATGQWLSAATMGLFAASFVVTRRATKGPILFVDGRDFGRVEWVESNPDSDSYVIHCANGDYETA